MTDRLVYVLGISPEVSDDAPGTWAELQAHAETYGPLNLSISKDGNENTIYGEGSEGYDKNVNARALHDYLHLHYNADFSVAGERRVAEATCELFRLMFKSIMNPEVEAVVRAEVVGQAMFHARWGLFVIDQPAFDYAYLKDPAGVLSDRSWGTPLVPCCTCGYTPVRKS